MEAFWHDEMGTTETNYRGEGVRRIVFCSNNGANIHSKKTETFTFEQLRLTEKEWNQMDEGDRNKMVHEWAMETFEYWYEEEPR